VISGRTVNGVIRDNTIDEIKSRCNIVDVVGRTVTLKKAGSNYKGLCPFHKEKTPSFVVSEEKQIYTCFGCGASGDVIEFVQKYYGLDFSEAVEKLAAECGVEIKTGGAKREKKEKLYEINKEAAIFFYRAFRKSGNPGHAYMKKRGIRDEVLKKFGIGYADGGWDSLKDYLEKKGLDGQKLTDLGLISRSGGKYYDKFRDRVIFPIIDTRGRIIGFGGRAIGEDMPKYLNSCESSVFMKKNNLYGLNITRREISGDGYAVLVEGYMDVISLYQGGVLNVAASLGTALTENQARLLKRYTSKVVLSYDADNAGQTAAMRGMDILHKEGLKVKVLEIPKGKDPDEFVKAYGRQGFIKLVKAALPYADYKFAVIRRQCDMDSTEGRISFIEKAVSVLKELSPVEADIYIKKLAADNGISEGAIRSELQGGLRTGTRPVYREKTDAGPVRISALEKNAIKLMLSGKEYFTGLAEYQDMFESISGRNIYDALKDAYGSGERPDSEKLSESLEPEDFAALEEIDRNILLEGSEDSFFSDCVRAYREKKTKKREKEIIMKLSLANEDENSEEIKKLTNELIEVQRQNKLGGKEY